MIFCILITSRQMLDSSSTDKTRVFNLDTFQHLLICRALWLFYIKVLRIFLHFSPISLDRINLFTSQTLFSLKTFNPHDFWPFLVSNHLVWSLFHSFFIHFMHLDLGFGFLKIFGVFQNWWSFCKIFGLGVA